MDVLKGYVEHIIYRSEESGYTVLNLVAEDEEYTCVGILPALGEGETIAAKGRMTTHAAYGEQFRIESYEQVMPEDTVAIERYLGSGAIKGIGPAMAARIVKKFKEDTFRIIEMEPERLAQIKGISERKAREIAQQVNGKKEMREAMIFLNQLGISNTLAVKLFTQYGDGIYRVVRENPYQMADEVSGVGFRIADEIARKAGIEADSDFRIRSAVLYVLTQAQQEGHIYLPETSLMHRTEHVLGFALDERWEEQLRDLAVDKKIVLKKEEEEVRVYTQALYQIELRSAGMLYELNIRGDFDERAVRDKIARIEKKEKTELDELQRQAVLEAVCSGVMVLTGGPGTGKTTTINTMITYFAEEGLQIALAAPTGRAAKRMTEATGCEASTIHRLLEVEGGNEESSGMFGRNAENMLEADVIIVDEVSMVDIYLLYALLAAIPVGTRLILVGDANQLPSVGPGSVLRDIIASGVCPVVRLTRIFRQAEQSDIVMNAHRINRGEHIVLDNKSRDFFFLQRNDANLMISNAIELVSKKLPGYVGAEPSEIQVLTPTRKGLMGVERLNRILQEYLNPKEEHKRECPHGEGIFREGDKVMQIRNNYQIEWEVRGRFGMVLRKGTGVFNGDIGRVSEINTYTQRVTILFDEGRYVEYTYAELEELELAYAVTIHKSQGSEYPAVVLPLIEGPRMLMNRNLLYTAVTRAKSCVVILGDPQVFFAMIDNTTQQRRFSTLALRLRQVAEARGGADA